MELRFLKLTLIMVFIKSFLPIADGGLLDAFNILGNGVANGGQLLTSNPIGGLADRVSGGNTPLGVLGGVGVSTGGGGGGGVAPQAQGYQQLNQRYPAQEQQQLYQNQRYPTQTLANQRPQPNAQNLQSTVNTAQKLLERLQELNQIKEQQRNQTANSQINQGDYPLNPNSGISTTNYTKYPPNNSQLIYQNNGANNYPSQNNGNQGLNPDNQVNNNNQNWQTPNTGASNLKPNYQGNNGGVPNNAEQPNRVPSTPKKMRLKKFFYQAKPVVPQNEVNNMSDFTLFYYD